MSILVISVVSFLASIMTFFSGFGLGTVLLPAMAIFYPISLAVVLTGIVHFANGALKLTILRKHVHIPTLWRFGLLAIPAAFLGANFFSDLAQESIVIAYSYL
jgi:uncharacterized membrane protein YfcA